MKKNGMDSTWISTGPSLDVRDSRFSIRYDRTDESTYILQIKDLQETDASTYECQVVLSLTNEVIKEVKLQVHKQPSISYNSTHSKVAAIGDEVELECYADGIPAPEITWRRENDAVLPTGGLIYRWVILNNYFFIIVKCIIVHYNITNLRSGNIFKIPSVAKEDRGNYYCIADNGVGRKKKHRVNIEVEFAPVVVAKGSRLGQALKYHTNLECHIEAYPPPVITWHKDGVQLTDNQHYTILSFSPTNQNIGTTLHITTIEKRHYGDYLCKAKNKVGNAEAKVELISKNKSMHWIVHFANLANSLPLRLLFRELNVLKLFSFFVRKPFHQFARLPAVRFDIDLVHFHYQRAQWSPCFCWSPRFWGKSFLYQLEQR